MNMEILSFIISLFSPAIFTSYPLVMAARTAAVACSQSAERWEPSSPVTIPYHFFPLSVLPLHGPRACTIADNLKPQDSGWMKEKGCPRELESTEIYCPRLIIRWYKVGQIPIEWQMLWKLSWYWNCVQRSHVRTCSLTLIHVDHLLRQRY